MREPSFKHANPKYANVTLYEAVHHFMELKQQWIKDLSNVLEVYGQ